MNRSSRRVDTPAGKPGLDSSYTLLLPFLIVLLTLIFSTCKDLLIVYRHKISLVVENANAARPLNEAAKQAVFIDSLHTDLAKLAVTDPVAARIIADFFSQPSVHRAHVSDDDAPAPSN